MRRAWLSNYLEGRSWTEVGYGNRYICSYSEALDAYSRAEHIFLNLGLAHSVARSQFLTAAVLFRASRYDECAKLNDTLSKFFDEFGDKHQVLKCGVLRAMVALFRSQFDTARDECKRLLKDLLISSDQHTTGVTYQCLGDAHRALQEFKEALSAYHHAGEIFRSLQMPSEINRAEFGVANVLLDRGEAHLALPIFARLREDYLRRNMAGEAGEIGLSMVDAFVALNQIDDARQLVERVLKEVTEAKLERPAIKALAYLRDVMRTSPDPKPAIGQARSRVEKAAKEPNLLFVNLDEEEDL